MYCKFVLPHNLVHFLKVLIVAKCIVNADILPPFKNSYIVLIVAKCIVNGYFNHYIF